ncbi:MAG TPA: tetratricopeptide repeat protein [Rhodobacterales bacterium]|nr:tetratricopeptide repeat protein [Rhodobacterales bacterium]
MPISRFLRPLGFAALLTGAALPALPALSQEGLAGSYLAAHVADMANDYRATVQYGARALSQDPSNLGLMEGLIMAEVSLGQIDDAVPVAHRLAALEAENQVAEIVLMADAMKREDWDAMTDLLAAGGSVGGFLDQMIDAWSAVGKGRVSEAVAKFDAMAKDESIAEPALIQKALALALVGDYEGAARIFSGEERVLDLNRAGIEAYAQVLSQLERNPDAVAMLEAAFPSTTDEELITLRAELAAGKPIPFTATTGPRMALAQLFYEVAQSILGQTDPGLVLVYARIATYLDPAHVGAILVTARVFEEMKDNELAAAAYALVPPQDRAYPQAQIGRAIALRRLGDVEAALDVLRALAKAHPELSGVHATLGDTLRYEKRFAEATAHYDAAIALFEADAPSQWGTYFSRAITLEREGKWEQAEADFRKALELNPEQPSVLNYLGYSYIERRENFDEALDMIKRAVAARPYDGFIRDSLGWGFYRVGRYKEAVDEMERAVELKPLDPVLNDHLGDTFWAVGRKREAEFQWRRALSFVTDATNLEELNPDRIRRKLEVGLDVVLEEEGGEPITK